jgi:hypothetical protein
MNLPDFNYSYLQTAGSTKEKPAGKRVVGQLTFNTNRVNAADCGLCSLMPSLIPFYQNGNLKYIKNKSLQ